MSGLWRCLMAVLCAVAFPLSLSAADQAFNASGTLTVNGATTHLRYAYAFGDAGEGSTRVLIANTPLTAAMLAGENGLRDSSGQSAFRDLVRKGEASAIELFVQEGRMETVMVFAHGFDDPTPCAGDNSYWYEPYRMSLGWIGGRSRTKEEQEFFDTKWEYDVAYFAPVGRKTFDVPSSDAVTAQKKEVDERENARIVSPGGGEEGAIYLSFYRNLEATNAKALIEQMTPAMKKAVAEQMQVSELSPSDLASFAMSCAIPPGKVEIVGGVRDPEGTLLELRKTMGTRRRFGSAKLVRDGGMWKVAEQHWW